MVCPVPISMAMALLRSIFNGLRRRSDMAAYFVIRRWMKNSTLRLKVFSSSGVK